MAKKEMSKEKRLAEMQRIADKIAAGKIRITLEEFEFWAGVHFTTNHTGKMKGFTSVSTSPEFNHNCQAKRGLLGTICQKCYSFVMQKRYKGLRAQLWKNSWILSNVLFDKSELPYIYSPTGFFRFEAFADLMSEIQVVNYFNMALVNPHMKCAIWTKNPWIIKQAMKHYGIEKPENLVIILSSIFVNEKTNYNLQTAFPFADKIFTVYDKKYIKKHGICINCGARSCKDCARCYLNYGGVDVAEMLK
jgi:hypothetical protein